MRIKSHYLRTRLLVLKKWAADNGYEVVGPGYLKGVTFPKGGCVAGPPRRKRRR